MLALVLSLFAAPPPFELPTNLFMRGMSIEAKEEIHLRSLLCNKDETCWRIFPISLPTILELQKLCAPGCPTGDPSKAQPFEV